MESVYRTIRIVVGLSFLDIRLQHANSLPPLIQSPSLLHDGVFHRRLCRWTRQRFIRRYSHPGAQRWELESYWCHGSSADRQKSICPMRRAPRCSGHNGSRGYWCLLNWWTVADRRRYQSRDEQQSRHPMWRECLYPSHSGRCELGCYWRLLNESNTDRKCSRQSTRDCSWKCSQGSFISS